MGSRSRLRVRRLIRRILPLLLLAGCSSAEQPATLHFEVAGRLEDKRIVEASGLARSQRKPGLLWTMNDSGKPLLYALDTQGNHLGRVDLRNDDMGTGFRQGLDAGQPDVSPTAGNNGDTIGEVVFV